MGTIQARRRAPSALSSRLVRLGKVAGAHGLSGAIRVRLDNPDSTTIAKLKRVFIGRDRETREYQLIDTARAGAHHLKLTLAGIDSPHQAAALRGAIVLARAADLPPAAAGEFYYHQAIGCEVRTTDGRSLGHIDSVFFSGAHDVWVIRSGRREILIPVVAEVVKSLDFTSRMVVIDPQPGLLD